MTDNINMADIDILRKIEGLQTIELVAEKLGLNRQSAINLMSKLKKERHVTVSGGGRRKRLYKVTLWRQLPRERGMFDIINKYSPNFQVNEWFDHQVHGVYTEEDALIDAIKTKSFRLVLASLRLFAHIRDWRKLYRLAKQEDLVQEVGALYDVARQMYRSEKIPGYFRVYSPRTRKYIIRDYRHVNPKHYGIEKKWNVGLPFKEGDLNKGEL